MPQRSFPRSKPERVLTDDEMAAYQRASRGLYGAEASPGVKEERAKAAMAETLELARLTNDRAGVELVSAAAIQDHLNHCEAANSWLAPRLGEDGARYAPTLPSAQELNRSGVLPYSVRNADGSPADISAWDINPDQLEEQQNGKHANP